MLQILICLWKVTCLQYTTGSQTEQCSHPRTLGMPREQTLLQWWAGKDIHLKGLNHQQRFAQSAAALPQHLIRRQRNDRCLRSQPAVEGHHHSQRRSKLVCCGMDQLLDGCAQVH